ncbi:MAG: succinate dehydrogenase cytochrome b subunit [Actinobacteria bacterium]|nr:succinate dehydrogenase cytochrome b subunit [Actinomycetota bacterium]
MPTTSDADVTSRGHAAKASTEDHDPTKPAPTRQRPFLLELYGTAVGKKYAMAITGIVLMGYVLAHLLGNLKLYLGAASIDSYGLWLRESLGYPILPHTATLWIMRIGLLAAFVLHIVAAYQLTVMNKRARTVGYSAKRDYQAADFAARTMRWTGVIVLLFVIYHLADFTWGVEVVNPDFEHGAVYANVVASFSRPGVAAWYILANLALGVHLYHGAWSLFQSMGWNNRGLNHLRRGFATGFAVLITVGNISFPIAVLTGIVG